jgi:Tetratricopeptide repeat
MSSPTRWLARGVCALVISMAVSVAAAVPQAQSISGIVETIDGKRLRHEDVRVTNIGGTVTSDSGEFAFVLPSDLRPGDPIELSVANWVIISPWQGRTFVPRRKADIIQIRVRRKGDPSLLTDPKLVQQIVTGITSRLSPGLALSVQPDKFLGDEATTLGFSVDQLKSAIDEWVKKVKEPYQKGLAALYARRWAEAGRYIQQSIGSSEVDLVEKYISLANADSGQGRYEQAEGALTKARAIQGENSTVLNGLGEVLHDEFKYAEAEAVFKKALAIRERELGLGHPDVAQVLNNLAALYVAQVRYADAEPLYTRALAIMEKTL